MIGTRQIDDNLRLAVLAAALIAIAATGAIVANKLTFGFALLATVAIIIFTFSFISQEAALYILIFAMLLGPQFILSSDSVASIRGRGLTLRFDDFLIALISLSWLLKTAINKDMGLFLTTPLNRPIAFYLFCCALSTVNGYLTGTRVTPTVGFFFVLKYFEYFIVYFMAVNHLKEKAQIRRFVIALVTVCFLVSLFGISQMSEVERVSAPFEGEEGEPNTLGGYLVFMLSLVIGLLVTPGSMKNKLFLAAIIPAALVALAATQSRGSWLAMPFMLLTLIYFSKRRLVIIIPLMLALALAPFVMPKSVIDRAAFTVNQPDEEGQIKIGNTKLDTSTSARLESWRVVLTSDFAKRPLLGYGVTGYSFVDAQYIKVLTDTGIIGIVAFFILLGTLYRRALKAYRTCSDPLFCGIILGYLGGFVALIVHGLSVNTFIIVRIMEPFWFLSAIVIMIPAIENAPALPDLHPAVARPSSGE
jgi:O-antigen ligase